MWQGWNRSTQKCFTGGHMPPLLARLGMDKDIFLRER
jgi:hypothetical protein